MVSRKIRVAVMMGGISSERDVSLSTGKQILESLSPEKYEAFGVDAALLPGSNREHLKGASEEVAAVVEARDSLIGSNRLASVQEIIDSRRPDVVLIALHGRYGEDGTVQGMLELLGIPYAGSGVLASALAMDKAMAKRVLAAVGIPVPPSVDFVCNHVIPNGAKEQSRDHVIPNDEREGSCDHVIPNEVRNLLFQRRSEKQIPRLRTSCSARNDGLARGECDLDTVVAALGYPVIVKPGRQGSTIGMTKVNGPEELNNAIKEAAVYDRQIVVEKFVEGIELTVGVLGNDDPFALPVIEIVPRKGFYDYEAKYTPGATEEIVPARISAEETARAQELALAAHRALGCRGMSRVDMILTPDETYVLEVNTIPGMTPTSLLPRAAEAAGISFDKLLDMLIEFALET